MSKIAKNAAHGGAGWSPRTMSLREEIGKIWSACGVNSESSRLKAVLMHRPGSEIETVADANKALMLNIPNPIQARRQHDGLAAAYRNAGVGVFYVEPCNKPPPNQMFVADLFFMTPEGALLARPASTVRSGEERFVAQKLAELGIPILRCVRGRGVFEGADAMWVDPNTVILGKGLRTNEEGAAQVESLLNEIGVEVVKMVLPADAMHLMGTLRFVDHNLAVCWRSRTPRKAVRVLRDHKHDVVFVPDEKEAAGGMALNFVTLGPKWIIMPRGNPKTQSFYESIGIKCLTVRVEELHKAAGGIGCLTGILEREVR